LERCYDVNVEGYKPDDAVKARALALDTGKRIACGVLFQREDMPSFYERLEPRKDRKTTAVEEVQIVDTREWEREFV